MTRKILTLLVAGIAMAAIMSYGCGGAGPVTEAVLEAEEETGSLFISGSIGDPTPIAGVYRDAYAEGDADGDSQGDSIYDFVGLSCVFEAPSVAGGANVQVVEGAYAGDYTECTSRNNCLTYFQTTDAENCSITIDATFREETAGTALSSSWIEIPVHTIVTLQTSMESNDGEVIVRFDSTDWDDAFVLNDVSAPIVDISTCNSSDLGILQLGVDDFWSENTAIILSDPATDFTQGYEILSTRPMEHTTAWYCECIAEVDMVGKVYLTDILTVPVTSIGIVHFGALLCDDDEDTNCLIGNFWSH